MGWAWPSSNGSGCKRGGRRYRPTTTHYYFNLTISIPIRITTTSFSDPTSFVSSYGDGVGVNQGFLLPKLGKGGFSGQLGPGQLQAEPYGFGYSNSGFRAGNVARETSNELSSMPNVNYYNGQCHKETEVLTVHRKGSSGGGRRSVLMEYEFFPAGKSGCRGATSCPCSKAVEFGLLIPEEEDSVAVRVVDGDHHDDQGCSFLATRNVLLPDLVPLIPLICLSSFLTSRR